MLKRTIGFLLLIALTQIVACVPSAHAASAAIILTHIQPGALGAATKEYVAVYNNSGEAVEITNWCLQNKARYDFACFVSELPNEEAWLHPYSYAVAASEPYLSTLPEGVSASIKYTPVNQSSGSIVSSSDTIALVNNSKEIVDTYSWTASAVFGQIFKRKVSSPQPLIFIHDQLASDWIISNLAAPPVTIPADQIDWREAVIMPEVEPEQPCPSSAVSIPVDTCAIPSEVLIPTIRLSELLPNPSGNDAGSEYIELYNYGDAAINLQGYTIRYGATGDKAFTITVGTWLEASEYIVLDNTSYTFTLPNTTGTVRLVDEADRIVDETSYGAAKDDQPWALFGSEWRYTKYQTPGMENQEGIATQPAITVDAAIALKPCAANQYRHPDTNRCRLLATTTAVKVDCKEGQYRNVETGRCRTAALTAAPAPCKEGQERNPDTNRCRTIRSLEKTEYGLLAVQDVKQPDQWYIYAAVGAIVVAVLSYACWEWRVELKRHFTRLWWSVLRR